MFKKEQADKVIRFIEKLKHTKAPYFNKPFKLYDFQKEIINKLYGEYKGNKRKYREAFIMIGRKNGKSELASALALYHLFADGVHGGEGYIAAADRDQASLIFNVAKEMVELCPSLKKNSKIIDSRRRIVNYKNKSFLTAIPSDVKSSHGFNASFVIFDEIHTQNNTDLYDVLNTSMGTREEPMFISITTKGFEEDSNSFLWKNLYRFSKDPPDYFYPKIYEVTDDDDWEKEENWYKANPALGKFRSLEEMRMQFKKAKRLPIFENTFKRLYLNMKTSRNDTVFSKQVWNNPYIFDEKILEYKPCYCGLDLASTKDITAFVAVFDIKDKFYTVQKFFIPEENMRERCHRDRVPYDIWAKQGLITVTPGNATDYEMVFNEIQKFGEKHNIEQILYDRWNALEIIQRLEAENVTMIPWGQGFQSMSWPSKQLIELATNKKIIHNNNEVLQWMAINTVYQQDAAGNIKPNKEKSFEKIDGIVALTMALAGVLKNRNKKKSVYESRGVLTI